MIFVHSLIKNLAIALQIIRCETATLTSKSRADARTRASHSYRQTDTHTHTHTHSSSYLIPISLWISVSLRALIIAPDLTLARHAATYHAGIPTQSSSQATMVGPFHKANGVPAFIASARSSCLEVNDIQSHDRNYPISSKLLHTKH